MIHFEVAVAAPLNSTLTYSLPVVCGFQSIEEAHSCIGKRVLVPLSGRRITGYVLSVLKEEKTEFVVRNVVKLLDERPLFHGNQIPFFRWVADYYHYPLGLVIKTALPGGLAPRSVRKLVISHNNNEIHCLHDIDHQHWVKKIFEKGELSISETRKITGNTETRKQVKQLIKEGVLRFDESVQEDGYQKKREICYSFILPFESSCRDQVADDIDFKTHRKKYGEQFGIKLKLSCAYNNFCSA